MTRRGRTVIVVAKTITQSGVESTTHYGPFLPHAGTATTTFVGQLEGQLENDDRYRHHGISVKTVFIGEDESDCDVRAGR